GWSRAELEAKPYLELVHPDDVAATEAEIAKVAGGATVAEYVCRIVTKVGAIRHIACSGAPGDQAFYIVGRDVTDRVDLEQELGPKLVGSDGLRVLGPAIESDQASVTVGELPTGEAEPRQMAQLLQNLVGNAVKFHAPDVAPNVTISARLAQRACVLTVADDG